MPLVVNCLHHKARTPVSQKRGKASGCAATAPNGRQRQGKDSEIEPNK